MDEKEENFTKHKIIYLSGLLIMVWIYIGDIWIDRTGESIIILSLAFFQYIFLMKVNKISLTLLSTIIALNLFLTRYGIYNSLGIYNLLFVLYFAFYVIFYINKGTSNFKWYQLVATYLIIIVAIGANYYINKDNLIKDRGLERCIKSQLNDLGYDDKITEANLKHIKHLHIRTRYHVYDLSGVEYLKNLEILNLDSIEEIRNLDKISCLQKLGMLNIEGGKLRDLLKIKNLESVTILWLWDVEIDDNDKLKNFPNLYDLSISKEELADLSLIKEVKKLRSLYLSDCMIESLDGIENLQNLESLTFDHTEVKNIEKIKELKSLKEIELWVSKVDNLDLLKNLPNIKLDIREKDKKYSDYFIGEKSE